jgi:hypothetical protein
MWGRLMSPIPIGSDFMDPNNPAIPDYPGFSQFCPA